MKEFVEFVAWAFWPVGITALEALAIVILLLGLRDLRSRHRALGQETTYVLMMHQDNLAAIDARLRALGSRTTGDMPIPTAEEAVGGRWMR